MTTKASYLASIKRRSPLERFEYYITERFEIRRRRRLNEPLEWWTRDPILSTYKFTNVRRAWDYTSEWLTSQWYKPHGDHAAAGMAASVARFLCYIPSLEIIGFPMLRDTSRWLERSQVALMDRAAHGDKVFTSAYMIAGGGAAGRSKVEWLFADILTPAWKSGLLKRQWNAPIDELHAKLRELNGWGDFMTQEVVLDLQETFVLKSRPVSEKRFYGWAGPGAKRGLNRLAEREVRDGLNRDTARDEMVALYQSVLARQRIPHQLLDMLTVHDIEFSLCEFDKYERVLWGEGTPKQKFIPRSTGEGTLL